MEEEHADSGACGVEAGGRPGATDADPCHVLKVWLDLLPPDPLERMSPSFRRIVRNKVKRHLVRRRRCCGGRPHAGRRAHPQSSQATAAWRILSLILAGGIWTVAARWRLPDGSGGRCGRELGVGGGSTIDDGGVGGRRDGTSLSSCKIPNIYWLAVRDGEPSP